MLLDACHEGLGIFHHPEVSCALLQFIPSLISES
jgi:hypothetical protein